MGSKSDMNAGGDESQARTDKETINKSNFDTDGTPIDWTEMEIDPGTALIPQPESFNGWSNKTGYVYDVRMKYVSTTTMSLLRTFLCQSYRQSFGQLVHREQRGQSNVPISTLCRSNILREI
jgi:hypothetical protein